MKTLKSCFGDTPTNTGRQNELDYVKAIAIICKAQDPCNMFNLDYYNCNNNHCLSTDKSLPKLA